MSRYIDNEFNTTGQNPMAAVAEDEIDLRSLVDTLLGGKRLIIAITSVCLLLGLAYSLLATPIYQADSLIQVEKKDTGLNSIADLLTSDAPEADTEMQVLQSRYVVGRAVDQLNLTISAEPKYFPLIGRFMARHAEPQGGPAPAFMGLDSYGWGGEEIIVKRLHVPASLIGDELTLEAQDNGAYILRDPDGYVLLRGQVGAPASSAISSNSGRPAVEMFISVLKARPGTDFKIVKQDWQSVVAKLQDKLKVSEQGKGTGIMRAVITDTDQQRVRNVMTAISTIYVRQNVDRRSAQAQESLNFLQHQLPELQQELNAAEDHLNIFRQQHESLDLTAETENLLGQMVDVEKRLSEAQIQRAELAQNFAAQHPTMQAIDAQIKELKNTREHFEQRAKGLPETQQQVLRLQRDVEVKTALYTALLNQAQELQVAKAGTIGNVRIVDQALTPLKPVSPNKPLVMALSLFLGLLLGAGAVFVRRALHGALHGPDELENQLGIPIYGVIPHSREELKQVQLAQRSKQPLPILAKAKPKDLAVEGIRSFRTGLHFGLMNSSSRTILITGPSPGVGKSFISINSAYVCGEASMRVLLIDADMRRGQLHNYHDKERNPGLSDVLVGDATYQQVVRKLSDQVDLIATGTIPPNPSELLMNNRFAELLQEVSSQYDLVIIDAPPVMAVTDATLIAPLVGAIFVVARAELNTVDEVGITIKRIQQSGARVTGIVFNDLGARGTAGRYGAYYYYRYNYNEKNENLLTNT